MRFISIVDGNKPVIREKDYYGGAITSQVCIKKTGNVLITGGHHSGKSKMLNKLHEEAESIWFCQVKPYKFTGATKKLVNDKPMLAQGESLEDWVFPEPVMLSGITPLSRWSDHEGLRVWYESKEEGNDFKKIPAWKRVELLAAYLKETRAILFIDDAHKLTGRKLQIVKSCIDSSYRCVLTTSSENRLSPSIRKAFLDSRPQEIRLNTEVAYDATHLFVWGFVVMCFLLGLTEVAAILGMLQTLKGGRNASRQD